MAHQVTNRCMRAAAITSEIDDHSVAAFEKSHGVVVGRACFILDPFEAGDFQITDVAAKDLHLREAVMIAKRLPPPQRLLILIAVIAGLRRGVASRVDDQ